MRLREFPAATRLKFRTPATWAAILAYAAGWVGLRFLILTDRPVLFSPWLELIMPFLLTVGQVALAPLPWLWTGDARREAPPLRGLLQAVPWNALWLGLFMLLMLGLDPGAGHAVRPDMRVRWFTLLPPLNPVWGIALFNYPLALFLGWFMAGKERAEAAERELRVLNDRTRAQVLQAQLNPHVLFNVLGGLTELVHEDPDAAEVALVELVAMYRALMRHGAAQRTPLREERELLKRYLGIEAIRLGPRLQVQWDWPAWADDLEMPPLLLQPLVENAIRHGIAPAPAGGRLRLGVSRTAETLVLQVANNGCPLQPGYRQGTGLGNLRERLALLRELRPALALAPDGDWTVVRLELAWRWREGAV